MASVEPSGRRTMWSELSYRVAGPGPIRSAIQTIRIPESAAATTVRTKTCQIKSKPSPTGSKLEGRWNVEIHAGPKTGSSTWNGEQTSKRQDGRRVWGYRLVQTIAIAISVAARGARMHANKSIES